MFSIDVGELAIGSSSGDGYGHGDDQAQVTEAQPRHQAVNQRLQPVHVQIASWCFSI